MLTKRKIASRILSALNGGQNNSLIKIDPREVYEAIESARNLMMEKAIRESGHLDGEYVFPYRNIPVLHDATLSVKYCVLPARMISFSDFDGIRVVSPMKNQSIAFAKLDNGAQGIYGPLEASKLHGNPGYYIEKGSNEVRLVFEHLPSDYDKVLIKMIASVYAFDEDEQLPIPAAHEQELVDMVQQYLTGQEKTPIDSREDDSPN